MNNEKNAIDHSNIPSKKKNAIPKTNEIIPANAYAA